MRWPCHVRLLLHLLLQRLQRIDKGQRLLRQLGKACHVALQPLKLRLQLLALPMPMYCIADGVHTSV